MQKSIIDRERVDLLMKQVDIGTYADLAKQTGLHKNTLTKILNGSKWHSDTIDKLAIALRCNPIDLISTIGYPSPNWVTLASRSTLLN